MRGTGHRLCPLQPARQGLPVTTFAAPSPGTRKLHRLEENIGAAVVELSAAELSEIEDAASKIQVQGGRYNDAAERMTNL
ncbi:hypothetical protein AB4074_05960 [Arthrobacter sp. 2MCAF14]